jgi:hypothetical protein
LLTRIIWASSVIRSGLLASTAHNAENLDGVSSAPSPDSWRMRRHSCMVAKRSRVTTASSRDSIRTVISRLTKQLVLKSYYLVPSENCEER